MADIPAAAWTTIGPAGLLAIVVVMVLYGVLVPRRVYNERVAAERERIAEKDKLIDKLSAALDKRDEQFDRLVTNSEKLISGSELTIHLLEEIKKASQRPDRADLT
jgi:hypothetical protein